MIQRNSGVLGTHPARKIHQRTAAGNATSRRLQWLLPVENHIRIANGVAKRRQFLCRHDG